MATGDRHIKLREERSGGSRHMLADRDTQTQTDKLMTIRHYPTKAE